MSTDLDSGILHGDCIEMLRLLEPESIDACVTDPPYELGFMGKKWDNTGIANSVELWQQVLRVLKPGGHLLSFGGTRTYHRMACAIEDAGFEIRDSLMWIYGTGFPKSLNVSKAIDDAVGAEREVVGTRLSAYGTDTATGGRVSRAGGGAGLWVGSEPKEVPLTGSAVTDSAKQWDGWGTALKPAHEPIVLARKPLVGTVAANVQQYGTGALNIDECRIGTSKTAPHSPSKHADTRCHGKYGAEDGTASGFNTNIGRWPANVVLDEAAGAMLDEQSGPTGGSAPVLGSEPSVPAKNVYGVYGRVPGVFYGDTGGASRFFYCAKASRTERDRGCGELPLLSGGELTDRKDGSAGVANPRAGAGRTSGGRNTHPTVKPLELMRWLVRLVTPPGGIVLDPFLGSGTTAMACRAEGFAYIGIEREADYIAIAEARIASVVVTFSG